jgi:hypothetical protein
VPAEIVAVELGNKNILAILPAVGVVFVVDAAVISLNLC